METAYVIEARDRGSTITPPPDDTVGRAQQGDPEAFEQLYHEHLGHIYALCLRMVRDEGRAEELTQEVFVRVWQKLGTFRGQSQFKTWLHRVAVNVVLKHLRTQRRLAAREADEELAKFTSAVHRAMPDTRMDLERALASLPPGARQVLVLHDIEGYRYREIAELMATAEGTVKSQLHRARRIMREALER